MMMPGDFQPRKALSGLPSAESISVERKSYCRAVEVLVQPLPLVL